jgi:hypothetical protein
MAIVKTELMWSYKPGEFLENGVNQSGPDFALSVEHGVACYRYDKQVG